MAKSSRLKIEAATPERWPDVETLFGANGACGGCWCMTWRQTSREYQANKGPQNKRKLRALVEAGREPGLIAYLDGQPVGWLALAPRSEYVRLSTSRVLAAVDEAEVWSAPCFFVAKQARGLGLTRELLRAAVEHASRRGAKLVEGYPVIPKKSPMPAVFAFTGLASSFAKAGWKEVARRSPSRPIFRKSCRSRAASR